MLKFNIDNKKMTNSIYLNKLYIVLISQNRKKSYKSNITFSFKIRPRNLYPYQKIDKSLLFNNVLN